MSQVDAIQSKLDDGSASRWDLMRAFGVMIGPSAVLDGAAACAIGSLTRAILRGRRPSRASMVGSALTGVYALAVRPWMLRWGATAAETRAALPGDDLVPDPGARCTRAVTIDAPIESVWPWLAQIGQDRAGFYSYEWLENLAGCRMHNADEIHPEWQQRAIGETVGLHHLYGLPVVRFEPGRVLALKGWGTFVTQPLPNRRTRLIARGRTARGPGGVFGALLMDIPHFLMERRMLLGIKDRAEGALA
jgi:hypothetical protein